MKHRRYLKVFNDLDKVCTWTKWAEANNINVVEVVLHSASASVMPLCYRTIAVIYEDWSKRPNEKEQEDTIPS